jgi:hypothetical protein
MYLAAYHPTCYEMGNIHTLATLNIVHKLFLSNNVKLWSSQLIPVIRDSPLTKRFSASDQ